MIIGIFWLVWVPKRKAFPFLYSCIHSLLEQLRSDKAEEKLYSILWSRPCEHVRFPTRAQGKSYRGWEMFSLNHMRCGISYAQALIHNGTGRYASYLLCVAYIYAYTLWPTIMLQIFKCTFTEEMFPSPATKLAFKK